MAQTQQLHIFIIEYNGDSRWSFAILCWAICHVGKKVLVLHGRNMLVLQVNNCHHLSDRVPCSIKGEASAGCTCLSFLTETHWSYQAHKDVDSFKAFLECDRHTFACPVNSTDIPLQLRPNLGAQKVDCILHSNWQLQLNLQRVKEKLDCI